MTVGPLNEARRAELGGLPAYIADIPGPTRAALIFRVGQGDETLPCRGITHLVEHLALGHFGRADAVGGIVDVLCTFAVAEGPPAEVAQRLHEIAGRFSDPPTDRLPIERRILSTEDAGKAPHPASVLMSLFYGPRGPGLTAYPEFGLRHATAHDVCARAEQWFTRENAALALTAPLDDLDELPLRPGRRREAVQTSTLALSPLPAEIALQDARMALGALLQAGDAANVLAALIERKAWSALRHEQGLAYDVECRAKPVGPRERLLYLTSDVGRDDAGAALKVVVEGIRRFAHGDFSAEELSAAQADVRRRAANNPITVLVGAATAELARGEARTPAEILAAHDAVTRDDIMAAATDLSEHLIATLPEGARSGLLLKLNTDTELLRGARFERRRVPRHADAADVIVGPEGVSSISPPGHVSTVRFDACVAAIREPGDALALFGETGEVVVVDPADLENGIEALAVVEASISPDLIVAAEQDTPQEDAAARAHRHEMHRLAEHVRELHTAGNEDEAKALVADALRRHPGDEALRQLERQIFPSDSTSKPARVVWNRNF